MTAPVLVVSAATLRPTPCLRCGRPMRVGAKVRVTLARHPSLGIVEGLRHERCPIRLTSRGRMVRDLAVAALAACSVVAVCAVVLAHWPALAAAMRLP